MKLDMGCSVISYTITSRLGFTLQLILQFVIHDTGFSFDEAAAKQN